MSGVSPGGAPLARELAAVARGLSTATLRLRDARGGEGCGVVWGTGDVVVTNAHVARGRGMRAWLASGETLELRHIAGSRELDLVALAIPGRRLTAATLHDAETLRPGEIVLALGHPLGVPNALALGVVHRLVREADGRLRWIAADLRLAPGNSGGPLAGCEGRVVGLNTLVAGGIAYAIPAGLVDRFVREVA